MQKKEDVLQQTRRPQDVPLDVLMPALEAVGNWLTRKLKGKTEKGPFSEANLGEPAIIYIPKRVYATWVAGNWKWKESLSLTTQLIRIARSEMSHIVRDWKAQHEPDVMPMSHRDVADEVAMAVETDLNEYDELKDLAYNMAEELLKDEPRLLRYVILVKELNDYRAISKRMKITMVEVKDIEAEMIEVIRMKRGNQSK